ncbi:MAG: hypothetical protein IPN87_11390 [Saprospiraceae bacterium]|nr:hypothetical protein [Candidatus Brachybacter algidus]
MSWSGYSPIFAAIMDDPLYSGKRKKKGKPNEYLDQRTRQYGRDYDGTRHNVGFEVLDYMAAEAGSCLNMSTG